MTSNIRLNYKEKSNNLKMKTILVLYCLLLKEIHAAVCSTLKPNGFIVFLSDDITNTKCYDTNEGYVPPADYDILEVSAYY